MAVYPSRTFSSSEKTGVEWAKAAALTLLYLQVDSRGFANSGTIILKAGILRPIVPVPYRRDKGIVHLQVIEQEVSHSEESGMSTGPIRVLIADGHPIVLEGLQKIFANHPVIAVVGEAVDGVDAIEKAVMLEPDVVLMDIHLPRIDGLTVLRSIQTRAPKSKVILFAGAEHQEEFVEAMKLGCSGVLHKDVQTSLIEKSILKVHAGEIWLDSNMTAAVMRKFSMPSESSGPAPTNGKTSRERAQLSQREREIIILIAQGYKNKEIAEKMFITEQTVKNHLHNVFDKLGVSDRLELALYAIHNSLHLKP